MRERKSGPTVTVLPDNTNALVLVHHTPEHVREIASPPQLSCHRILCIIFTSIVHKYWCTRLVRISGNPEAVQVGTVRGAIRAEVVKRKLDVLCDNIFGLGGSGRAAVQGHDIGGVHGRAVGVETDFGLALLVGFMWIESNFLGIVVFCHLRRR